MIVYMSDIPQPELYGRIVYMSDIHQPELSDRLYTYINLSYMTGLMQKNPTKFLQNKITQFKNSR